MFPPHLSYLKEKGTPWFNPAYGIIGFWNERKKIAKNLNKMDDFDYVWNHRELKKAKEIYITSFIAMAMSKQEQAEWWIHKPKNDPPDGVIGTSVDRSGIPVMEVRELEIVEHIKGEILDTIRKKIFNKQYEPNTILVCHVSSGGFYDFQRISDILIAENGGLNHIFFTFFGLKLLDIPKNTSNEEFIRAITKISVVQTKPIFYSSTIDLRKDTEDWRAGKQPTFFIFGGIGKGEMQPITLEKPPELF